MLSLETASLQVSLHVPEHFKYVSDPVRVGGGLSKSLKITILLTLVGNVSKNGGQCIFDGVAAQSWRDRATFVQDYSLATE